jgi:multidrug resistance efflux pump
VLRAGDAVRAAEVHLARVEAGADAADLAAADASVAAARAAESAARAQVGVLSAQVDAASAGVRQARERLRSLEAGATGEDLAVAEAEVRQARVALGRARDARDALTLTAPFDGTVGALLAQPGETVLPGQALVSIGDLRRLRVETTDLRETDVARVSEGQAVEVTFDGVPELRLPGRVAHVAPMASQGQGGTNYTVWVELDRQDDRLRWGMTAYVNVYVER